MPKNETMLKEPPKLFSQVLDTLEDGELHRELSRTVQDMNNDLGAIAAAGGTAKGELTIKLKFSHDRNGTVQIASDIATKMPKATRQKSMFWLLPSGNLSGENPRQTKLPLRSVEAPGEVRAPEAEPAQVKKI